MTYARRIREWRAAGYDVKLWFLSLPTPEAAIDRVALRVRQGGHDIPEEVIRRRFAAGSRNFRDTYRKLVTDWQWLDNSGAQPRLIEEGTNL